MVTEKYPLEVNGKDLRLGDTVRLGFAPYGDAIVYKLTADSVGLRRPYMVTADFSMGGDNPPHTQVITYVGLEDFNMSRTMSDKSPFMVVKRGDNLK